MHFFAMSMIYQGIPDKKTNKYLTNLSEKGYFSSQRQIVTAITYRTKSEKQAGAELGQAKLKLELELCW